MPLIGDILERGLRTTPHATAATLDGRAASFADVHRTAERMAAGLRAAQVRKGDLVVWWTDPSLDMLAGMVAGARTGAIFCPVNPRSSPHELTEVLDVVRPSAVVVDEPRAASAEQWAAAHAPVEVPVTTAEGLLRSAADSDTVPHEDQPNEDDPHIAYLTSGSTGRPKAVLVSHRASWLRAAPGGGTFSATVRGLGGVVGTFPLYHYGGWHYVMEAWLAMTAIHLVPRADGDSIIDVVRRWRPSALYCIPAVWERVLDSEYRRADLSSLHHCDTGTSPVTGDLITRIKERIPGSTTSVLYGSTEAGRMAALADWELADHPESVGRPAFPCSLWVDESAEVCVRTPGAMLGYLHDPEQTRSVLHNGVYRSGDLGLLDDNGYLHLTGRVREMIRTGGEFVAPIEVEHALAGHPDVADIAVVGVPDRRWGEVVCAAVVPRNGVVPDLETLRAHATGRLAPHKHPRRLEIVDSLPRTAATGQLQRAAVRTQVLNRPSRT